MRIFAMIFQWQSFHLIPFIILKETLIWKMRQQLEELNLLNMCNLTNGNCHVVNFIMNAGCQWNGIIVRACSILCSNLAYIQEIVSIDLITYYSMHSRHSYHDYILDRSALDGWNIIGGGDDGTHTKHTRYENCRFVLFYFATFRLRPHFAQPRQFWGEGGE